MKMKRLRDATRPARRAVAKRIFDFPEPEGWDHAAAQRYEIAAARRTIMEFFARNYAEREALPADHLYFHAEDQWFCGNHALFEQFRTHAIARACLEIGSGPFGHLGQAKGFHRRTIIDPLIDAYREIELTEFGKTFFTPDVVTHAAPAEQRIASLVGQIDGLIVTRNCLDHCDDPLQVLVNIGEYALPGCWLFLWSDVWHLHGADQGHRNITRSATAMRALLDGLGFTFIQEGRPIRDQNEFIEFSCVARKR